MACLEALCNGSVEVVQEQVEDVVVDAPVFLHFLETEEAELGAVFGDALADVCAAADANGVNAQRCEETGDAVDLSVFQIYS